MLTLELDMYQACALGALVYCLGRLLVQKLPFLSKYCIPAPVAGGVVFAFAHLALYATGVLELSFDTTLQSVFMTILLLQCRFYRLLPSVKEGRRSGIYVPGAGSWYLYRAGCSRQRSGSSVWSESASRLMYGFYAVSWRSRNEWFLRTASGAGIRSW